MNGTTSHHGDEENKEPRKTPLQMICQGSDLPGIPKHPTFKQHRQWMLEQMALAFRVFARKDYTDGMAGHITVRDPEHPHTMWIVSASLWWTGEIFSPNVRSEPVGSALRSHESKRHDPNGLRWQGCRRSEIAGSHES